MRNSAEKGTEVVPLSGLGERTGIEVMRVVHAQRGREGGPSGDLCLWLCFWKGLLRQRVKSRTWRIAPFTDGRATDCSSPFMRTQVEKQDCSIGHTEFGCPGDGWSDREEWYS